MPATAATDAPVLSTDRLFADVYARLKAMASRQRARAQGAAHLLPRTLQDA